MTPDLVADAGSALTTDVLEPIFFGRTKALEITVPPLNWTTANAGSEAEQLGAQPAQPVEPNLLPAPHRLPDRCFHLSKDLGRDHVSTEHYMAGGRLAIKVASEAMEHGHGHCAIEPEVPRSCQPSGTARPGYTAASDRKTSQHSFDGFEQAHDRRERIGAGSAYLRRFDARDGRGPAGGGASSVDAGRQASPILPLRRPGRAAGPRASARPVAEGAATTP